MMDWQRGYVSDLAYLTTFCDATAPSHLRAVQLLSGQDPGPADAPFRCLEIGAGSGIGLSIIAAANPCSEFVALDYHPGQVATGRRFARASGLDNFTIVEGDLVDAAPSALREFGQFAYIICHGVYSWVDDRVRDAIVTIIRQCAAPGALVFFGYNSLPGWTLIGPMQKLIAEYAALEGGRSVDRLAQAVAFMRQMSALDAKFIDLAQIPVLGGKRLNEIDDPQPELLRYLAHEYLTENWRPAYHQDVARTLATAKLSFVNSTTISDMFLDMTVKAEQQDFLKSFPAGPFREQLKDYFSPSMYRRDVFVRGPTPISESERSRLLDQETLTLVAPADKFNYKLACRAGEASLPHKPYTIVLEMLAKGPATIGEVRARLRENGLELQAEELFGIMIASAFAAPLACPQAQAGERIRQFNATLADFALRDATAHHLALAAVKLGNGLPATRADFIFYRSIVQGAGATDTETIVRHAIDEFDRYGDRLIEDGQPVVNADRHAELVRAHVENTLTGKIRIWRETGAI